MLSEEARERASVTELKLQLQDLQQQIEQASQRLAATQSRVDQNLSRVAELKAEAAALERLSQQQQPVASAAPAANTATIATSMAAVGTAETVDTTSSSRSSSTATLTRPASPAAAPRTSNKDPRPCAQPGNSSSKRARPDRGLKSSLEAEPALKEFWYPAEFSSCLTKDTLIPFELFDEPWVLFR